MSLDSLYIDGVVLLVRADELDENDPVRVVDGRDQAILVASDIEDHAPVPQNARSTKVGLDVRLGFPLESPRLSWRPGRVSKRNYAWRFDTSPQHIQCFAGRYAT